MREIVRTAIARLSAALSFAFIAAIPAFAADLGKPAAPEPAKVVEMVSPFQGLYIGAMLGHATGSLSDAEGFRIPRDGYTGTALVGYNHRVGLHGIVVGLEGDFGLTGISGSTNVDGFTIKGSNKFTGHVLARVGRAWGHTMLYAVGGVGITNAKLDADGVASGEKNIKGLAAGVGMETMIFDNLGIRIQYLHDEWKPQGFSFGEGVDTGKLRLRDDTVQVGLVFRLN